MATSPVAAWKPYKPPTRPKAPTRPKVTNPFAPLSEGQIVKQAHAETDPALNAAIMAISGQANSRSTAGTYAIRTLTDQLAHTLAGYAPATQAGYQAAESSQAGVDKALNDRLAAAGQSLQGELNTKLGAINAPAGSATAVQGGPGAIGAGAAATGQAMGSAEQGRLISQGASAQDYAAKLPGFAAASGLQAGKQLQTSIASDSIAAIAAATKDAAAQYTAAYQHLKDTELQKAIASASGLRSQEQIDANAQYKAALLQYQQAKSDWQSAIASAKVDVARTNAQTSKQRAGETHRHNTVSERQHAKQQRETHRHNTQTEKNKGKSAPPWQTVPKGK